MPDNRRQFNSQRRQQAMATVNRDAVHESDEDSNSDPFVASSSQNSSPNESPPEYSSDRKILELPAATQERSPDKATHVHRSEESRFMRMDPHTQYYQATKLLNIQLPSCRIPNWVPGKGQGEAMKEDLGIEAEVAPSVEESRHFSSADASCYGDAPGT